MRPSTRFRGAPPKKRWSDQEERARAAYSAPDRSRVALGSPQEQIESFRAFEIPERLQEEHGYPSPALTPARKAKILGLDALAAYGIDADAARAAMRTDGMARAKAAYVRGPRPPARGPRTRRELIAILRRGRR